MHETKKWWQMPNVGIGSGRALPPDSGARTSLAWDRLVETFRVWYQPESVVALLALKHESGAGPDDVAAPAMPPGVARAAAPRANAPGGAKPPPVVG